MQWMLIISARREERNSSSFFLFDCAMLDRFKKLVAVAEEMVTEYNNVGQNVDGIVVDVEHDFGVIRIGVYGLVSSAYCPDDNVVMPEYGVAYHSEPYHWKDGRWEKALQEVKPVMVLGPFEEEDELPF